MNRCPITYENCGNDKYSQKGLKKLSPKLETLLYFPYSAEEQRRQAAERTKKMSIQGIQPKLSTILNTTEKTFEIVDINGKYILKPQHHIYPELPENEDLTMRMAETIGIEIPFHGLIYSKDESLTYFIKRFDRIGRNKKVALEDFAQLAGKNRDTKYNFTMEKIVNIIDEKCTFPAIDNLKLFRLLIFNFLTGNEDMHLKNYSLITRNDKIELSPAYDLLNTTIALNIAEEEIALYLNGKKNNLKRQDFIEYFAFEHLKLTEKSINNVLNKISKSIPVWIKLIDFCFLSDKMKQKYIELIEKRRKILNL